MNVRKTAGMLYSEGFALLKKNYWKLVLISAIILCAGIVADYLMQYAAVPVILLFEFLFIIPVALFSDTRGDFTRYGYGRYGRQPIDFAPFWVVLLIVAAAIIVFILLVSLIRLIFTGTAEMGAKDASVVMAEGGKPSFDAALGRFGRRFWRYLGINAWVTLWSAIWGLLLVVPGVVRFYSYRMAPYLVLQYPQLTIRQALRKSIQITGGFRGRLFALDMIRLAFGAGVMLAGCFLAFVPAFVASIFWLMPLGYALYAVAWLEIRKAAVDKGQLPNVSGKDNGCPGPQPADPLPAPEYMDDEIPQALPPAPAAGDGEEQGQFTELEDDSPAL